MQKKNIRTTTVKQQNVFNLKRKLFLLFYWKISNLRYASVNDYQISSIVHNELQVLANTLYSFHYEAH